ncbi:MAG: rane protein insertase, YidC/Oxa1 family [Conexibacter sp.]|nr:rane protein insertase, YidC/Oxa1 family [Conexibacter sp.]
MPFVFANILQPLIDVCDSILVFFHDKVGVGWGLSIIFLTITVRLVLLPLTLRQVRSMQRLQVLAPEIRSIQAKYKDDKQRQQQEMMKFYKENKVNPLASCFPLLFQLPFFISLYYMLRTDLRIDICGQQAVACGDVAGHTDSGQFLFIHDITNRATGVTLVVLVILYVGSQLGSGLLSSATMDRNQRMIMLGLPIVFVFFVINFPAGLMVYWITTNCWTIVQQLIVRRTVGPVRPVAAMAGAPGTSASSGGGGLSALRDLFMGGGAATAKPEPNTAGRGGGQPTPAGGARAGRASTPKASPKAERPAANGAGGPARSGPPPSSRQKKKRSGRRR